MNILIIGSGGREHALGWKIKQSPKLENLYFAPGNGGTSTLGSNEALDVSNHPSIVDFCKNKKIDLVVIGPDDCLADGLTDILQKNNIMVFGPTKAASKLEWSKKYAKQFMFENNIPTATYMSFDNSALAIEYVSKQEFPVVIKADGLALGKGVVIAKDFNGAKKTIHEMIDDSLHGEASKNILIEEYLDGQEISAHVFCDGEHTSLFPSSQDHKRIYENDEGPNTGGMGTIAPVSWVTDKMLEEIEEKIVTPTLHAMKEKGTPFVGILFPGIMMTKNGPKVIEFNARFGDPETQSYMRLLDTDLIDVMVACIKGKLDSQKIKWKEGSACCVVLASGGYPGKYKKGFEIKGLDKKDVIFHAGTKVVDGKLVTTGGRVLGVTAFSTLKESLDESYGIVDGISFEGMQYRKDIGKKSLK